MKTYIKASLDRYFSKFATKSDLDNLYLQLSSFLEVREIVGPRLPLGPLRGWALSPDALIIVLQDILMRPDARVVEFGAGESTIAIAATMRNMGSGSLVSIEQDRTFATRVTERLRQCGLLDRVDMRVVPLRKYDSCMGFSNVLSYNLRDLAFDFDIALVDGPSTDKCGVFTRAVPLNWCLEQLSEHSVIYLDDAARPGEIAIIDAIKKIRPNLGSEWLETEKGLCRLNQSVTPERP